jgi:competence protein ComEC
VTLVLAGVGRSSPLLDRLEALHGAARGRLFAWCPVFMGAGAGLWLALPLEPGGGAYGLAAALALAACGLWWRGAYGLQPLGVAILCLCLGFLAAGLRSYLVAGPVLGFRYYGPVEGRIVLIDRSQSYRLRLTLDRVVLEDIAPDRTPVRVRVALHGVQGFVTPEPGQRVMLTAHLGPPEGPVEPGGFDFQRMAWFRGLGAVGYTRTPVLLSAPPEPRDQWVNRLRMTISAHVQAALPGESGAFAAAVLTGDRSGVGRDTTQALRDSNLAHLLAISGLHMGLLTGFVFVALRIGLALVPPVALRVNTKKLAAVVALGAAVFYLMLSGGNIATQRAFVMVAVMLGAVLADRRALSLRSVALAALILLAMYPEAVAEPGFQMSFAATAALIAGFAALRDRGTMRRLPRWLRPVAVLVVSSSLAGFATAPVAAAHFGRIAEYGLIANLLAVPMMGTLVVPFAVVAAVLSPLGLQAPALWLMQLGTGWILGVAHWVAGFEGAVRLVPAPHWTVLPVMALGGVWVILVAGRWRWAGVAPMVLALMVWAGQVRPPVLISADGGLLGVQGAQGRVLSAPRGNGFTASIWLENDGDSATQDQAATREGFSGPKGNRRVRIGETRIAHLTGKGALAHLAGACAEGALVVTGAPVPDPPPGCRVIDATRLAQTGPVALWPDGAGGLTLRPTKTAQRVWSGAGFVPPDDG